MPVIHIDCKNFHRLKQTTLKNIIKDLMKIIQKNDKKFNNYCRQLISNLIKKIFLIIINTLLADVTLFHLRVYRIKKM